MWVLYPKLSEVSDHWTLQIDYVIMFVNFLAFNPYIVAIEQQSEIVIWWIICIYLFTVQEYRGTKIITPCTDSQMNYMNALLEC